MSNLLVHKSVHNFCTTVHKHALCRIAGTAMPSSNTVQLYVWYPLPLVSEIFWVCVICSKECSRKFVPSTIEIILILKERR